MVADVTRGQLLRLPWDYERYGLDPDEQSVAAAVRASISVPYLFEPVKLEYPGGESLLVDGGLVSNFPIDAFDRTDGRPSRWPTFGVTLLPQLPAGDTKLLPGLGPLRLVPGFHFLESVITTAVVGRDQATSPSRGSTTARSRSTASGSTPSTSRSARTTSSASTAAGRRRRERSSSATSRRAAP